ncbi:MAG: response regulator transcription factor [Proteobacteria bacterium]|nr:response regulator transcription factor [Pseudomonadota bacterium]
MKTKPRILVIEDETAIRTGLTDVLIYHGYDVEDAADGTTGLERARSGKFDLILLDIMLPGINGFDICNAIREVDPIQPIIMLTARTSDEDIVHGLKLGADDYVAKPFSIEQLMLRVAAVLRRTRLPDVLQIILQSKAHRLLIDTLNLTGQAGSNTLTFTRREMDILIYLHQHNDRPVPRDELLSEVWGYARGIDIETRTVDIHIAKLRRKLEPNPKEPDYLLTVRGAGYRLMSES